MTRPLLAVTLALTTLAGAWFLNAWLAGARLARQSQSPMLRSAVLDPFESPLLQGYRTYRDSLIGGDLDSLGYLAHRDDSFLAYRASLALARSVELDPAERLVFYRRALQLRVADPLARQENREFHLEMAATAEAAGDRSAATDAYAEALPDPVAVKALERLESDPYRLANTYLQARLYRDALEALDGRAAPSIEAPAHRRLGEHQKALDAYERWLVEQPDNFDARLGRAWSHFYLADSVTAYSLFSALDGSSSLYARALIDRRQGNLTEAVNLIRTSGVASWLWLASSWLEAEDRYAEALSIYLQIAPGDSVYADDAAYRALVLAERLGDQDAAQVARELVPSSSFFGLHLGSTPTLPDSRELPQVNLEVQDLALELARANDSEAAIGELVFALRESEDEATVVSLAETLQLLGEFRQSQRAAQRFVDAGSREVRTWKAAYPRAYPELVRKEAAEQDLDPALVWAVMRQESAFYPNAVSTSNAAGLMQVIPSTWDWLAELQKEEPGDRFDPAANIRYGSYYLRWLMNYHDGDTELVIPSYNRGQGYIRRLFDGPVVGGDKNEFYREIDALETREYLQRVMVNYRTYQALYEGPESTAAAPAEEQDQPEIQ
ncbi:MAG: transglycosylase SLT domain-containing protein [Trueperaceae bacterium]